MKWVRNILILAVLDIAVFVNLNEQVLGVYWNLFWYCQFYICWGGFATLIWKLTKDLVIRSLLIALSMYYVFHFFVNLIDIYDHGLKLLIYKGKYINYILALSFGVSLLILPIWEELKAWVKRFMNCLKS